jgi:SAM-dependent methyltransferase
LTRDWEAYHALVAAALEDAADVVEVGCGDGAVAPFPWRLFPHIRLPGIDPDPAAARHPFAERVLAPQASGRWPLEDHCADLLLARYVLEHVERPEPFLAEARRVLRPGGRFLFLTPNRLHPAAMASRLPAVSLKRRILRATRGVDEEDVFPTWYRLNTAGRSPGCSIGRASGRCGWKRGSWSPARIWRSAGPAAGRRGRTSRPCGARAGALAGSYDHRRGDGPRSSNPHRSRNILKRGGILLSHSEGASPPRIWTSPPEIATMWHIAND